MTEDEARDLLNAYPLVKNAIAYTEHIICGDADDGTGVTGVTGWDIMMRNPRVTPAKVLSLIQKVMKETHSRGVGSPRELEMLEKALQQSHHAQYLTYLLGKMGAV